MPRKYPDTIAALTGRDNVASMRPGRMPRKYPGHPRRRPRRCRGFNEAGADAPEIPACMAKPPKSGASFNEAGADAPEIPGEVGSPARLPQGLQ